MHHLSLPQLVAAAEDQERASRRFFRMAQARTGAQRLTLARRAQAAAISAHEFREWAGCG
ncbi:MAG: hypothetical protein JWL91_683 [Sphingomonas bacterium]|nr:hypothetical protein [Sphingomonas bacterium]MDB5688807.1 hypothetical protein [Sphingomonas bacterium]